MYGDHNQLLLLIGHLNLRVGSHLLFIDPIADIVNGQCVPDKNRRDKTHMIISGGNDRDRTVLGKFVSAVKLNSILYKPCLFALNDYKSPRLRIAG